MKFLLALGVGAILAWIAKPTPPPVYERVVVSDTVLIEREPDTVRTFVDRIRTVQAPPEIIAIAPRAVEEEVAAFCRPVTLSIVDTVEVERRLLLRSVSHDPGWFWQKDALFLSGPTNTGDLVGLDFSVRPGFTARTVGDSVLVQYPRTALLRDLFETLAPALGVYLLMR